MRPVVDVANVMGSRADGWWRDRAGAACRLAEEIVSSRANDEELVLVLEGAARSGVPVTSGDRVRVVHAPGEGDDTVVAQTEALREQGRQVTVVTADRVLRDRVTTLGAQCRGPRWLLDRFA